jgi:hypothetical protein
MSVSKGISGDFRKNLLVPICHGYEKKTRRVTVNYQWIDVMAIAIIFLFATI